MEYKQEQLGKIPEAQRPYYALGKTPPTPQKEEQPWQPKNIEELIARRLHEQGASMDVILQQQRTLKKAKGTEAEDKPAFTLKQVSDNIRKYKTDISKYLAMKRRPTSGILGTVPVAPAALPDTAYTLAETYNIKNPMIDIAKSLEAHYKAVKNKHRAKGEETAKEIANEEIRQVLEELGLDPSVFTGQ